MNPKNYRVIFHIDMNAFFAACEIANDPTLKGKPVVVAHNDIYRKSIILTASYEARKFGIKTTMMVKEAIKLCNNVIVKEPNYKLYTYYSKLFFEYLYTITPKVEVASIDEGYLDVTEVCENINALDLATKIQTTLLNEYNLPTSIGIAPNKFLAKMASDMKKPLGITVLRKREIDKLLWPLKIEEMIGVGKKTLPRLNEIGIYTIKDLATFQNIPLLEKTIGEASATYLKNCSLGIDNSLVNYEDSSHSGSISNSLTFDYDTNNILFIKKTLKVLINSVSYSLTSKNLLTYNIGIKIKYFDYYTISRSKSVEIPTNDSLVMYNIVDELFDEFYENNKLVRLVGVFAGRVCEKEEVLKQYTIFDDFEKIDKENDINQVLRKINNQYNKETINIGCKSIMKEESKSKNIKPIFMKDNYKE